MTEDTHSSSYEGGPEGDHDRGPLAPEEITADSPFTLPGFFAALADDQLLAGRCGECETQFIPPRPACYACGSREVRLEEQPRSGEIVSYTAVHRPPSAFADLAPFTVAVVELDSGARLTGRVHASYDEVRIGLSVRLSVIDAEDTEHAALDYETDWPLHVFDPD